MSKEGLTRTKGQRGKGKSVEGLGQAATSDTTAVIRPPQNKPEEHSALGTERGSTDTPQCASIKKHLCGHKQRTNALTLLLRSLAAILCDAFEALQHSFYFKQGCC